MCISNKSADDTDAAGPETTPSRTTVLEKQICCFSPGEPSVYVMPDNRHGD